MAEFVLRPKAIADLEDIWDYTVKTWGSEQAERYLRSFNESFRNITDNPDIGRSCDGIREGYRKRGVGRHVIFYRTIDGGGGVDVVRILHERMDIGRHLRRRHRISRSNHPRSVCEELDEKLFNLEFNPSSTPGKAT